MVSERRFAGKIINDSSLGDKQWNNPSNAIYPDEQVAVTGVGGPGDRTTSYYLKATNFGFTIPSNAIINGIEVRILRKADFSQISPRNNWLDNAIFLVKDGVVFGSNNFKSDFWGTNFSTIIYGNQLNTTNWSPIYTFTPSDINNSNFGVVLSVYGYNDTSSINFARVDSIDITVYYSLPEYPKAQIKNVYVNGKLIEQNESTISVPDSVNNGDSISISCNIKNNSDIEGNLHFELWERINFTDYLRDSITENFIAQEEKNITFNEIMPNRDYEFFIEAEHEEV